MSTLSDEITNDPLGRGYSGMTDKQVAADLNTEYRPQNRDFMPGWEVWDNVVYSEWADSNKSDAERDRVIALCSVDQLDPFGSAADIIVDIFGGPGTSTTTTNLQAARVRNITRAAELGLGRVRAGDVFEARQP